MVNFLVINAVIDSYMRGRAGFGVPSAKVRLRHIFRGRNKVVTVFFKLSHDCDSTEKKTLLILLIRVLVSIENSEESPSSLGPANCTTPTTRLVGCCIY